MLLWVNSVPVVCWYKRTRTKQKDGQVCFSAIITVTNYFIILFGFFLVKFFVQLHHVSLHTYRYAHTHTTYEHSAVISTHLLFPCKMPIWSFVHLPQNDTSNRRLRNASVTVNLWVVNERWLFSLLWCAGASSVTTNSCHLLKNMDKPDLVMVSRSLFRALLSLLSTFKFEHSKQVPLFLCVSHSRDTRSYGLHWIFRLFWQWLESTFCAGKMSNSVRQLCLFLHAKTCMTVWHMFHDFSAGKHSASVSEKVKYIYYCFYYFFLIIYTHKLQSKHLV